MGSACGQAQGHDRERSNSARCCRAGNEDAVREQGQEDAVREQAREDAARAGKMLLEQVIAAELLSAASPAVPGQEDGSIARTERRLRFA